jgi:hypothetical protein
MPAAGLHMAHHLRDVVLLRDLAISTTRPEAAG